MGVVAAVGSSSSFVSTCGKRSRTTAPLTPVSRRLIVVPVPPPLVPPPPLLPLSSPSLSLPPPLLPPPPLSPSPSSGRSGRNMP